MRWVRTTKLRSRGICSRRDPLVWRPVNSLLTENPNARAPFRAKDNRPEAFFVALDEPNATLPADRKTHQRGASAVSLIRLTASSASFVETSEARRALCRRASILSRTMRVCSAMHS
jgi:hypothetical protein